MAPGITSRQVMRALGSSLKMTANSATTTEKQVGLIHSATTAKDDEAVHRSP